MKYCRAKLVLLLLLSGCAAQPMVPAKLDLPARPGTPIESGRNPAPAAAGGTVSVEANPQLPAPADTKSAAPAVVASQPQAADISLNFESLPLPAFIQSVYAIALKRTVNIDPAVESRKDGVTLHSGKPLTAAEAESSARLVLKSFGVAVQELPGLTRFVPDNSNSGYLPEIRRGRALPDSPLPLRPVFQLVELQAVRNTDVAGYIKTLFKDKVTLTEDIGRNAVMLAGNGDDVQAAMEAIRMLDQPLFKGRESIRITPQVWSADELTKRLTEILTQEGYAVGTASQQGGVQYPITLLPVPGINTVIVFAQSKDIVKHIVDWANVLDKPVEKSVGRSLFTYVVKNTDATRLAETIDQLLQGSPGRTAAPVAGATTGSAPAFRNVVVDKGTNTLLFRASGDDYNDIIRLLHDLDRPSRQVLIEVTVAEVSLGDTTSTGVDWIFSKVNKTGLNVTGLSGNTNGVANPTLGPSATGSGSAATTNAGSFTGFIVSQLDGSGSPRIILNALATDNKATVLSSPRLVTRNGEEATFQVGSEVPVVTSQQTTSATGGGGVLQSVQYRNTGVILKIKPVIHSSDQVDLAVNQEVSAVKDSATAVGNSPSFSKRSLDTKLTLKHGETVVLGGLISSDSSNNNKGIPFIKDIPILGRAFGSNTDTNNRTELVILITPYIISDDGEARAVTDAFRKQLGSWAEDKKMGVNK